MSFICNVFGHANGEWMDYYKTTARHPSRKYFQKCVRMRVCSRCKHEEIQLLANHEYPALGEGEKLTCQDMKNCDLCGKAEIGAPHKIKDCRCSVCRKEIHDWEGCYCKRCSAVNHSWSGCKCHRCGKTTHEREGSSCRCRKCGEGMHELKGCTCVRCGETEHQMSGCKCQRCGQTYHLWDLSGVYNGYFYNCKRCRSTMHRESGNVTEI